MLEMRPNCECCDADLPADRPGAFVCSYECTFCAGCVAEVLRGRCPNCGGDLMPRPTRSAERLAKHPASAQRVLKPHGCAS
jgi:hypothetical protein